MWRPQGRASKATRTPRLGLAFRTLKDAGATLLPAAETTARKEAEAEAEKKPTEELNVDAVFARLKQIGGKE